MNSFGLGKTGISTFWLGDIASKAVKIIKSFYVVITKTFSKRVKM